MFLCYDRYFEFVLMEFIVLLDIDDKEFLKLLLDICFWMFCLVKEDVNLVNFFFFDLVLGCRVNNGIL